MKDIHTFILIFLNPHPNLLSKNVNSTYFTLVITLTMITIWKWKNNLIFINESINFHENYVWLRDSFIEFQTSTTTSSSEDIPNIGLNLFKTSSNSIATLHSK